MKWSGRLVPIIGRARMGVNRRAKRHEEASDVRLRGGAVATSEHKRGPRIKEVRGPLEREGDRV